uniref:Uncharacterized protein n=1 Tax=Salmonella enterica subsp. enterica serovar Typhimurium var. 5- TaxID=1620419 RepID=A0A3Q8VLK6_SALTM|nr:hypothetical protein [Salmonella enterica subsp. enterica serovar Typhimurium var. 5-]
MSQHVDMTVHQRRKPRDMFILWPFPDAAQVRQGFLHIKRIPQGTVAKLAMRQPFVLFKGLTFQKLCLPGAFRPGDHHNKMLRPGLCVVHASPQYL